MRPIYYTLVGVTSPALPVDRYVPNSSYSVQYSGAGTVQYTTDDVFNVTPSNWTNVALVGGRASISFPVTAFRVTGGLANDTLQIVQQGDA